MYIYNQIMIPTVSNLSSEEIELFVEFTTNFTRSPNTDLSRQCEAASTPFLMSTLYKCGQITWQSYPYHTCSFIVLPGLSAHTCILGFRRCSCTRGWGVGSLLGREGLGHKEHWSGTQPRPWHSPAQRQVTWPWSPTTLGKNQNIRSKYSTKKQGAWLSFWIWKVRKHTYLWVQELRAAIASEILVPRIVCMCMYLCKGWRSAQRNSPYCFDIIGGFWIHIYVMYVMLLTSKCDLH